MQTRARETVDRILASAEELFLSRNYADVTMEGIAEAAGVTKGALYHHFESKEELYLAMMTADLDEKRRLFRDAVAPADGCRDRLRALTAAYFALAQPKRDLIHLVRRDGNVFQEPFRSRLVRAYQSSLPEIVEEILAQGMRGGEVRPGDARLLSWHFVALVEVTLTRYAEGLFADPAARLDHVLDFFFHGAEGTRTEVHA